jgi:hypothetical protein
MRTIFSIVSVVACLGAFQHAGAIGKKPGGTVTGTATLYTSVTNPDGPVTSNSITPDALGAYPGTFDRSGNFSFNLTGTARRVCFNFSQPLALLDPPRVENATPPASGCYAASFVILATANTSGITSIGPNTTEVRSVRFNWDNPAAASTNDPENYYLGFRGDSNLDGRTDMSRVKVTCDLGDAAGACLRWQLEPCATFDGSCGPLDVPVNADGTMVGAPVGRAGGGFSKGRGNSEISRYVLPWRMTIVR